uniref:C3H1-type domain-containing protein n=1 Tax=Tanacetum cinerariifolium TaxID=118510 RepID=A0A6L2J2K4_TANCI|nr:hypothetical protein [Tanacetum cinerariifolium]
MTGPDNTLLHTPLSEKLSLVTHHHLLTRVPVKLDIDNWNFGSWEFIFEELCASYEVDKYLRSPINETSALAPLTPEETKVDKIVLSWILFTLSDSLHTRIVVARPKSAKEAWSLISDIFKDNKRYRTNTLKAELRLLRLGIKAWNLIFLKLIPLLTSSLAMTLVLMKKMWFTMHLRVSRIHTTKFVATFIGRSPFPISKRMRSLLIAEEMRLKSKVLALPMDSSSPMVLVAETRTNSHSSTSRCKSWKPCFNFAKVFCRFGDSCRYVHDANAHMSNANSGFIKGRGTSENTTNDLLTKLLAQLGHLGMNVAMSNNGTNVTLPTHATVTPTVTGPNIASNVPTTPHAFYTSPCTSLGPNSTPPPGFPPLAQAHVQYYGYTTACTPTHLTPPTTGPVHTTMGSCLLSGVVNTSRKATLLPQAFTEGTPLDPTTGAVVHGIWIQVLALT